MTFEQHYAIAKDFNAGLYEKRSDDVLRAAALAASRQCNREAMITAMHDVFFPPDGGPYLVYDPTADARA